MVFVPVTTRNEIVPFRGRRGAPEKTYCSPRDRLIDEQHHRWRTANTNEPDRGYVRHTYVHRDIFTRDVKSLWFVLRRCFFCLFVLGPWLFSSILFRCRPSYGGATIRINLDEFPAYILGSGFIVSNLEKSSSIKFNVSGIKKGTVWIMYAITVQVNVLTKAAERNVQHFVCGRRYVRPSNKKTTTWRRKSPATDDPGRLLEMRFVTRYVRLSRTEKWIRAIFCRCDYLWRFI